MRSHQHDPPLLKLWKISVLTITKRSVFSLWFVVRCRVYCLHFVVGAFSSSSATLGWSEERFRCSEIYFFVGRNKADMMVWDATQIDDNCISWTSLSFKLLTYTAVWYPVKIRQVSVISWSTASKLACYMLLLLLVIRMKMLMTTLTASQCLLQISSPLLINHFHFTSQLHIITLVYC